MTEFIYILSDFAANSIRVLLSFFFVGVILKANPQKERLPLIVFAGIAISLILTILGNLSIITSPPLVIVIEAGVVAFLSFHFFKKEIRLCIFVSFFYEVAIALGDFLIDSAIQIISNTTALKLDLSLVDTISVWFIRLLIIAVAVIVWKKKDGDGKKSYRFVSIVSLLIFFSLIALSQQNIIAIDSDALGMWFILAIILMVSIVMFNMNRTAQMERELALLKETQSQLLERNYTALNHAYSINARLFHDFHNHIGVLYQMLSHEKNSEALQYLNDIKAPALGFDEVIWTGDETTDYLINSKAAEAANAHIRMEINIEFPQNTSIRAADMCAILGNFLDNAMEACQSVPESSRYIRVVLRRINDMLIIKVENSFSGELVGSAEELSTTKTEDGIHGWGLKSAKIAAGKYDGIIQTNFDNGIFRAVATLSFDKIKANG